MRPRFLADLFHANQVALGPIRDRTGSTSRANVIRTFRSVRPQKDASSNKSASSATRTTCFADSNHHKETWRVITENGSFRSG